MSAPSKSLVINHSQNHSINQTIYNNNNNLNSQLTFLCANNRAQQQRNNLRLQFASHKMHKVTASKLLTGLYCSFVIILALSLSIAPAYCDQLLPKAPSFTSLLADELSSDTIAHARRFTRSSDTYANDYSSSSSSSSSSSLTSFSAALSSTSPTANSTNKVADKNIHERYLAAMGLRTRYKPQQFYAAPKFNKTAADTSTKGLAAPKPILLNDLQSLNLVSGARDDICKHHCTCQKVKNSFTTVSCDFQQNWQLSEVFGTNFKVPEDTTAITIKLASKTNFRLERGFFNNNRVNSISIEGTYSEHEQVEITTEAFHGNYGGYTEIRTTNVFSLIIRTKAFSARDCKISIRNSNELILFPDSFQNASINGLFAFIKDLRIEEKAFNSAQAKLRIESSHIDNIYRFEASLREIRFVNCTIGTINGGTFDVIAINVIVFEGCRIDVIKARAITEKFFSDHVSIKDAIIGTIESEAIYRSGITELILTENKIDSIHENAIQVTAFNATITRNNVKHLGNNWLSVKDWSNIVVSHNQFGVFGRMMLDETKQPMMCRFESNSLTQPLPGSLNITNRYCMMREISVNIPCKCHLGWLRELTDRDLSSEVYCTIDDKLSFCFNATTFNTLKYLNEVCDENKTTLDCVKNMNLKKINGVFFTPEELEQRDGDVSKLKFIVAVGAAIFLVLAVIAVIVVALRYCRRSSNGNCIGQSSNRNTTLHCGNHLHDFSTAERNVIAQSLQVMQKKYPDIHKQVNERVQILLERNLSDKKCVKIVSNIVDLLDKIEQPGEDFVAFNRVLTQHLQPQLPTAPADPIYAEPSLGGLDEGFYTTSAIVALPTGGGGLPLGATGTCPTEPIYAEPNCAQQPLLRNEYASPADGHIDTMDLYTEPINEREPNNTSINTNLQRLPQYAMSTRNQKLPSIPSTSTTTKSKNLPDVLYQSQYNNPSMSASQQATHQNPPSTSSRPLTNVQKMAHDLQNMPKFHINTLTQSSTNRNLHLLQPPVYSAPDNGRRTTTHLSRPSAQARLPTPEAVDECELDMRGATALPPPDSGSNHSGGSDETVKIDDVIQYVDA